MKILRNDNIIDCATELKLDQTLLSEPMQFGVCVGTFAALPYIHLQLEARKRLYPHVLLLVHDDGSPQAPILESLCKDYAVDFETNRERCTPFVGDLTAFYGGLVWAREKGVDLLLKLSRRFLPLTNWTSSLSHLALKSQYASFSSWTETFNYGFRSECVGMAVSRWWDLNLPLEIAVRIVEFEELLVEAFIHQLCRRAASLNCQVARNYDLEVGLRPADRNGYAVWDWMGYDRLARSEHYLWHDWAQPSEYYAVGRAWGLPYRYEDYLDPNAGFGVKRPTR